MKRLVLLAALLLTGPLFGQGQGRQYPSKTAAGDTGSVQVNGGGGNLGTVIGSYFGNTSGEFRVNTYTTNGESFPAVSAWSTGFVVAWVEDPYGAAKVKAQRYSSVGAPAGAEFSVFTSTHDSYRTAVAADASGNFVVVWDTNNNTGESGYGIFAQRYAANGTARGTTFRVNSYTTGTQYHAGVAMDSTGNFLVVWNDRGQGGTIYGQRYASTGAPAGSPFAVSAPGYTNSGITPAAGTDSSGNFTVAWTGGAPDLSIQRYSAAGAALGGTFGVDSINSLGSPGLSVNADGSLVAVWAKDFGGSDSSGLISGQRFSANGTTLGAQFIVDSYTDTDPGQRDLDSPKVATEPSGKMLVVWRTRVGPSGAGRDTMGRWYAATGAVDGSTFAVNTYTGTHSPERNPAVAAGANGQFVVAWENQGQDGDNYGVFAQRLEGTHELTATGIPGTGKRTLCVDQVGVLAEDCSATVTDFTALGTVTAASFVGPLTGNAATATALAANPSDCSASQYANSIAASGNLTCAQVAYSQLSGAPSAYLSGTSASIGGGALTASCTSGTATVTGAAAGMFAGASPNADITSGLTVAFSVSARVSATDTVTVTVCGTGTPTAATYTVRVVP